MKSKVSMDEINVNALILIIWIRFGSMRGNINVLLFIFRTNFPIRRCN